jgi:hypothetical protein
MDPISNADRLVLLLRLKLEERAKANASSRSNTKPRADTPASPSGVRALASIDWSDERPLRRAIIQSLLADQFGADLVNDAQFQQIVSRVADVIEDDAGAAELLTKVVAELRRS